MKKTVILSLIAAAATAAGWIAGTFLPLPLANGPSPARTGSLSASRHAFASVPDVRQSTGYTCGAAALQAVLAYWGTSEREDRLAARLNSTPERGTHPLDIVRVAREFGLSAELREGLSLADL